MSLDCQHIKIKTKKLVKSGNEIYLRSKVESCALPKFNSFCWISSTFFQPLVSSANWVEGCRTHWICPISLLTALHKDDSGLHSLIQPVALPLDLGSHSN